MPERRMASSGGLHDAVDNQPENSYRQLQGDVSKHVQSPSHANPIHSYLTPLTKS